MCVTASSDTNRLMASASDFSARRIFILRPNEKKLSHRRTATWHDENLLVKQKGVTAVGSGDLLGSFIVMSNFFSFELLESVSKSFGYYAGDLVVARLH